MLDCGRDTEQSLDNRLRPTIGCAEHDEAAALARADGIPEIGARLDHPSRDEAAHAVSEDAHGFLGARQCLFYFDREKLRRIVDRFPPVVSEWNHLVSIGKPLA